MITFMALAAFLIVIAVVLIAVPLLKPVRAGLLPAAWTALACAGVLLIGSTLLYAKLSNWSWSKSSGVASPESMVEGLVHKLDRHPNDLNGWLMLGRSYVVLKEYPLAVRAYRHADRVAGGKSADALLGESEALILINGSELMGHAGRLIEQALALAPRNPRALFFGAAAALHRGDLPLARARFQALLALNPPANVRALVRQQIATIDDKLPPQPAASAGQRAPAVAGTVAEPPTIRVRVRLAPALAGRAPAKAPLYVFVRDPGQQGPPLAVKRLASRFPQTVELTPADAMIPGHAFTAGERVEVVARIAPSGNPLDASGDLSGRVADWVGHRPVTLLIDHVTP